jgi:hypothetical protein
VNVFRFAGGLRAAQIFVFLISVAAGGLLATAILPPQGADAGSCSGSPQKQWVFRQSSLAAYGIDGYLRHPSGAISDPSCNFLAHFIAVFNSSGTKWVQVGLTIGVLPSPPDGPGGAPTTYKIYSDGINHCGTYNLVNHGDPTSSNRPYYISYSGQSGTDGCGSWAKFNIRKDSWLNQPIWYRYIDVASGPWIAENEALKDSTAWPDTGQPWWGHESATTWPLAYGLAWYNYSAGTWNEWTSTQGGTTGYISDPSGQTQQYRWCVDSVNRAHHALKGASC